MGEKKEKKATSSISNKASRRVKQGFVTASAGAFIVGAIASAVLGGKSKSIDQEALEAFNDFSKPNHTQTVQGETSVDVIVALPTAPATTEKVETEQGVVEVETQEVVTEENQPGLVINVKAAESKEDKIAQYLQNRKEEKTETTQHVSAENIIDNFKLIRQNNTTQSTVKNEENKTSTQSSQKAEKPTGYASKEVSTSTTENKVIAPEIKDVEEFISSNQATTLPSTNKQSSDKLEEAIKVDFSLPKDINYEKLAEDEAKTSKIVTVPKDKGLMFSFAAGPSLVVSGNGINFDLAMGLALSVNLSEHTQFYTSIVAGTGVPLGKNATFGDFLNNGAAVASAGIKITWGGKNVKYSPDLSSVSGAIKHNVKLTPSTPNNPSTPDTPDTPENPTDGKGNISYDTGHYDETPSNGNTSIGADQGTTTPSSPFPDNDSFGFDFER